MDTGGSRQQLESKLLRPSSDKYVASSSKLELRKHQQRRNQKWPGVHTADEKQRKQGKHMAATPPVLKNQALGTVTMPSSLEFQYGPCAGMPHVWGQFHLRRKRSKAAECNWAPGFRGFLAHWGESLYQLPDSGREAGRVPAVQSLCARKWGVTSRSHNYQHLESKRSTGQSQAPSKS